MHLGLFVAWCHHLGKGAQAWAEHPVLGSLLALIVGSFDVMRERRDPGRAGTARTRGGNRPREIFDALAARGEAPWPEVEAFGASKRPNHVWREETCVRKTA
jgi:hypothetical protein